MLTLPLFVLKLFSCFDAWKQFFLDQVWFGTFLSGGVAAILTSGFKRI